MSIFSDNLKYLRERAGMSRNDLAKAANVANASIGFYETGKREPQASTIIALAAALNVSTDTLLGVDSNAYERAIEKLDGLKKVVPGFNYCSSDWMSWWIGDTIIDSENISHLTKDVTALHIPPIDLGLVGHPVIRNGREEITDFWYIIVNQQLIKAVNESEQKAIGEQSKALNVLTYLIFSRYICDRVSEVALSDHDENYNEGLRVMFEPHKSAHEKSAKADDSDQGAKKG